MNFGLINSFEKISSIYKESTDYLSETNLSNDLSKYYRAYHTLFQLIPLPLEKVFSGHAFSFMESKEDLERSYLLCCLGFYKYAYISLRTVFELGLLSVYWDKNDDSHLTVREWLNSRDDTPFKKKIIKGLLSIKNVSEFQKKIDIALEIESLYQELSDYTHTKGYKFSSRANSSANFNQFSSSGLQRWVNYMMHVVRIITTVHILKYPIAMQETPIDEKYGIDGPIGLLNPHEAEYLKCILDSKTVGILQGISDNVEEAVTIAEQIRALPNITKVQLEEQFFNQDKLSVEGMGFNSWFKHNGRYELKSCIGNPEGLKEMIQHVLRLKEWARENQVIESKNVGIETLNRNER